MNQLILLGKQGIRNHFHRHDALAGLLGRRQRWHLPDRDDPTQCRFRRVSVALDRCDRCTVCTVVRPATVLEPHDEQRDASWVTSSLPASA